MAFLQIHGAGCLSTDVFLVDDRTEHERFSRNANRKVIAARLFRSQLR
jgi:hypothetical protein